MFYKDDLFKKYDQDTEYIKAINYLLDKYTINPDNQILASIIGYSWFYYIEGDLNSCPKEYDWSFFRKIFENYFIKYIEKHDFDCLVDFISYFAIYISEIHFKELTQYLPILQSRLIESEFELFKILFLNNGNNNVIILQSNFNIEYSLEKYFYDYLENYI